MAYKNLNDPIFWFENHVYTFYSTHGSYKFPSISADLDVFVILSPSIFASYEPPELPWPPWNLVDILDPLGPLVQLDLPWTPWTLWMSLDPQGWPPWTPGPFIWIVSEKMTANQSGKRVLLTDELQHWGEQEPRRPLLDHPKQLKSFLPIWKSTSSLNHGG